MSGEIVLNIEDVILYCKSTSEKLHPFIKVVVGNHFDQSYPIELDEKISPWKSKLSVRRKDEEIIRIEVWNHGREESLDLVGESEIEFASITHRNLKFVGWVPLTWNGERVGEINVEIMFYPDGEIRTGGEGTLGSFQDFQVSDRPEELSSE
jgi:hypothetical protein